MNNFNKETRYLFLAIAAALSVFLYQLGKLLNVHLAWQYNWILKFLISCFFLVVLVLSIKQVVKKQFSPLLVQLGSIVFIVLLLYTTNQVTDTEKNFHIYKDDREELIQLVLDGKIGKNQPQYSEMGYFTMPWGYMDEFWNRTFQGQVHSDEMYFFFFPTDTQGIFGALGPGVFEGFVYSSLNRPPTWQEFDAGGQVQHIEGPWYYLNSEKENFKKDCPTLCK